MDRPLLEVGDILYSHHKYGKGINKHTVTRTTKTQAILDNSDTKVKRQIYGINSEYGNLYCNEVGGYGNYYLETDDLKQRYEWWLVYIKATTLWEKIDLTKLTTSELASLYNHLLTLKEQTI